MTTITAKPIEWQPRDGYWDDRRYGFYIEKVADEGDEAYEATWGEVDSEFFPTLESAQAWCQNQADRLVSSWAVVNT